MHRRTYRLWRNRSTRYTACKSWKPPIEEKVAPLGQSMRYRKVEESLGLKRTTEIQSGILKTMEQERVTLDDEELLACVVPDKIDKTQRKGVEPTMEQRE